MWFLGALLVLEIVVYLAEPMGAKLAALEGLNADTADAMAYQMVGLSIVITGLLVIVGAWGSMRGGFIDHLGYIFGLGVLFSHLARHLDLYNTIYMEMGSGTVTSEVLVLLVYVLLPGAVTLIPLLSLPFVDLLPGWVELDADEEDYE